MAWKIASYAKDGIVYESACGRTMKLRASGLGNVRKEIAEQVRDMLNATDADTRNEPTLRGRIAARILHDEGLHDPADTLASIADLIKHLPGPPPPPETEWSYASYRSDTAVIDDTAMLPEYLKNHPLVVVTASVAQHAEQRDQWSSWARVGFRIAPGDSPPMHMIPAGCGLKSEDEAHRRLNIILDTLSDLLEVGA